MRVTLRRVLPALLPLALWAQAPPTSSPCSNTPAYTPCEMSFELGEADAAAHPNPYATVDLRIEFRSPRQRTLAVPGYWDGGRRMVVRFSPTEAGAWDFHITSNISEWNDRTGNFTAAASASPGFIRAAALHHWAYTERGATGLDQPHLWMGAAELGFAALDDPAFNAVVDARAAQKFNHLRGLVMGAGSEPAYASPDSPNLAFFQRLDARVRYLNGKGLIVDLVLAPGPGEIAKMFQDAAHRRRFARFLAARYCAMNVTWQAAEQFEDPADGRALLAEVGRALKEADPYGHPRSSGARVTSAPLLDDGWMDYAVDATADNAAGSVEHQLFGVPFVNVNFGREDSGAGKSGPNDLDAATLRHRLWNSTMNGQYPTYSNTGSGPAHVNAAGAKQMTVWFDAMSETRHWELEPYFDVDGGRALALEETEYLVYIEKPGPLELVVEKHGYEIYWIDPATGEKVKGKKFSGDHFTGQPPNMSHDWVLHVVREGRQESMNRSYKFESREYPLSLQEVESSPDKVPFTVEQPTGSLAAGKPVPFAAKVTRATRATRSMMWLWTGEVAASRQGFRVLATAQKGTLEVPAGLARDYPATLILRLYGMNAVGKVYSIDRAFELTK